MIAFSIGPINVYWYGIFYLFGFLIGYFFLKFIAKKKFFSKYKNLQNLLSNDIDSLLIYIILGVLLGGRLGEVFIYEWTYFSQHLLEIFAVWNGGMSFIGGITGVFVSLLIMKKVKKLSNVEFFLLFDTLLVVVPLAIMLGRFGNYLNQEIYGLVVPINYRGINEFFVNIFTKTNIFHVYDLIDSNLRINTNFISIFFEGLVLFFILSILFFKKIKKKEIKPGIIIAYFLIFYSLFRFFIEYLRIDSQSQYVFLFTKSQRIFLIFILTGFVFMWNKKMKKIKL
ncbi:MAG: prolipoprotein diacylglyceryl transferase [Candidatus Absconditabacterales bacterium]|nr:prolipoprotein diacylglyceryl transferase [Candidatus Absconditabacterales bacterium]